MKRNNMPLLKKVNKEKSGVPPLKPESHDWTSCEEVKYLQWLVTICSYSCDISVNMMSPKDDTLMIHDPNLSDVLLTHVMEVRWGTESITVEVNFTRESLYPTKERKE